MEGIVSVNQKYKKNRIVLFKSLEKTVDIRYILRCNFFALNAKQI